MKGLRIRPEHSGLRASLFDLEAEIMEIIWLRGKADVAVSEVHSILEERRELAYTTVMTTMTRLHDKGLLARRKDGRRYVYQAAMTEAKFIETMTREVLGSLPAVGQQTAIALLVEQVAQADASQLDAIEAIIRARRSEERSDG
jgi:predicted transcriptional regulator